MILCSWPSWMSRFFCSFLCSVLWKMFFAEFSTKCGEWKMGHQAGWSACRYFCRKGKA